MSRTSLSGRARDAVHLVTIGDIAVRCGTDPDTVSRWPALGRFPDPAEPAGTGRPEDAWWWPDVLEFIGRHQAGLAADLPLLAAVPPRPLPGWRGGPPGPRILDPFCLQVIRAMRGQVDEQGRARYTARQIAASLPFPVKPSMIYQYAPGPGRGGDLRTLPDEKIAEMRGLRARTRPDGRPEFTLRDLAARFDVSDITVSRYCRDIQPPGGRDRRHGRQQPVDADGRPLDGDQVRRVQAMRAERGPGGARRHTREQVAEACGVTTATVARLERGLTGPRRPAPASAASSRPGRPARPEQLDTAGIPAATTAAARTAGNPGRRPGRIAPAAARRAL